ncbi:MAG: BON domain-containing protein [Paludisphaera borealis]|uniref:BON domain-containing protein n=1 Tax=Paludisphaera borealis TaxID=1387353 RepID=UPI00283C46D1|nr:BON domain-containing protein [Paludisphaera borealis]MDR3618353.1 BON domain-containing protein [Paludisphaera borealis]
MKAFLGRRAATLLASTLALILALAAGGAFGMIPQEPGAVERAGEKLDEAGRQIKQSLERGFGTARDAVREQFSRTRDRVNDMNVEARVYGRLHWDKLLTTSVLELTVEARGIVTLRGSVPTAKAKKRAVELAIDTVGVTRVIDQLAVQTPTSETTTTTPGTTTTTTVKPAPAPAPED